MAQAILTVGLRVQIGNAPAGTMRKFHMLLKFIDDDHYTLEWHESIGGKELFDTVLNFTRKRNNP
jgi:hypothetical protein